jgi:hypothetical protein
VAIDTAEKRRAVAWISIWILPGVTPNVAQDEEWRGEAGHGYPFLAPPLPALGTDRKIRRGRDPWKPVEVKVILREPPVQVLIQRQKLARDMRVEQERLAQVEQQQRKAAIDAAVALVESQAKDAAAAFERKKKSMASLAVANLAREKKRQAEAERIAAINRKRMENLKKARKGR